MDKQSIYFIGGSPCAGKSTVAEYLSQKYDMYYFKVDDQLDRYTELGAKKGLEMCFMFSRLNADQTWMRDPQVQCRDELAWYEEIFDFFLEDISKLKVDRPVITEGAAFLPVLMKKIGVAKNRYISITPTAEFQLYHYKQRHWIPYILADCKDKEKCYENWMNRDILFAKNVRQQCAREKYHSVVNDGSRSIEETRALVIEHFELNRAEEKMNIKYIEINADIERMIIEQYGSWVRDYNCLVQGEGCYLIAAMDGNTVAGFAALRPEQWIHPLEMYGDAFIEVIEVKKEYQRQGIGSQLVKRMEIFAKEYGYYQIRAWSSDDKVEALHMWYKLNFCMCPAAMLGVSPKPGFENKQIKGYYYAKLLNGQC